MLSGIFQECFSTYIICVYTNSFNLHKRASDADFVTLFKFIYSNIELTKSKCVLQLFSNCTSLLFPDKEKYI